jgi:hypothetical protein
MKTSLKKTVTKLGRVNIQKLEVKKVSDRNKSLSGGSEEREEGNVTEKSVVDTSLLRETCDGLTQMETDDNSTEWSQRSPTLKLVGDEQNSENSIVPDISVDSVTSVVHVNETLQQNSY